MAKKSKKKVTKLDNQSTKNYNKCPGCLLFIALIILLVWWKPAVLWAQIVNTIVACLMLVCHAKENSMCNITKK